MSWLDQLLCPMAQAGQLAGASLVVMIAAGVFGGVLAATAIVSRFQFWRVKGSGTAMPGWVAAFQIATAIYLLALILDPLIKAVVDRPPAIPADAWERIGFFEHKILGGEWSWPILPLADHPAAALVVHLFGWAFVAVTIRALLVWLHRHQKIDWDTPEHELPWYYRWTGSSTARRADHRFNKWIRLLLRVAVPVHLLSGYLWATKADQALATNVLLECATGLTERTPLDVPLALASATTIPGAPAPGIWVLTGFLLLALSMHMLLEGRPSERKDEKKKEDEAEAPAPPPDPLRRLGDAIAAKVPGAFLESLETHAAEPERRAPFPEGTSPLVREAFTALTGTETPYVHQIEVLDHLRAVWQMTAPSALGPAPVLREELGPSPVQAGDLDSPHALVLLPEGAGRTTLTCLAALYVHLDRGATTLAVVRDLDAAREWAARLRDALTRTSARWNVEVVVAGEDMAEALLAGRTPAVIVAGLEELEADVLASTRTDPFFAKLGLVVADDVDRFTGVAELHLHMTMRRLWALTEAVQDAPYPVALLAVAGPSASGMEAWARHVLAAPMRLFDADGAPRVTRALLRRRDLADGNGEAIPLAKLTEACDAAALPWHIRRAGDAERHARQSETILGSLRRHHVSDPSDAEVVLIEGTYPDVHREAERLAHAGARTGRGSVVLVLAPPADEEMVLHEEAVDAEHAALVTGLPRAVPLSEPVVVRQRHLDRALGREQDVAALRKRFGAELVDEIVGRLDKAGRIRERHVWHFDPRTDDAVARRLVRTAGEGALGEPIAAECVSESTDRAALVDQGTSETLAEVDRAIANALYPPGSIVTHARGRYRALGALERTIPCEQVTETIRTTPSRAVSIEADGVRWAERQLGGAKVRVARTRVRVTEVVYGIRTYAPGPRLVEDREYERPVRASYATDASVIVVRTPDAAGPSDEAIAPLAAAIRMILPCYLRASEGLVDAAIVTIEGARAIAVFDRTPGGSGFAFFLHERGLGELLALARLALERLVGPERRRLRAIHDVEHGAPDETSWRIPEALAWLDAVLDPPRDAAARKHEERRGRRVEWIDGEGTGDLGRLWISSTGRTDDLVWTRHRWRTEHPIGDEPPGDVYVDVAVERRTIGHALRRAAAAGAATEPRRITDDREWIAQHRAALVTASIDLVALIDRLRHLAGERFVDTVLDFVAAIPTSPEPLPVAQRAPLAVLARRRADRDAKVLLAWAMLPAEVQPTVRLAEDGPVLQIARAGQTQVVDLSGRAVKSIDAETGRELSLDWGSARTAAEGEAEDGAH